MRNHVPREQLKLQQLRKQTAFVFTANFLLLFGGVGLLQHYWDLTSAFYWFGVAGLLLSYEFFETNQLLAQNHHPGQHFLLTNLGAGNGLTIIRGMVIAAAGGFLATPSPTGIWQWLPGLLYLLAVLGDRFDGYLARRTDHVTLMGAQLDMRLDALGILIATFLGLRFSRLPVWYLLVGFTFYFFTLGKWYRLQHNKPVYTLPADPGRPLLAGLQMGFLSVSILPIFPPEVTRTAAIIFGVPLLVTFLRDWLIVSGRYHTVTVRFPHLFHAVQTYFQSIGLPVLRLLIVVCGLVFLTRGNSDWVQEILSGLAHRGIPLPEGGIMGGMLLMFGAIGCGVLTRIVSLLLMGAMGGILTTSASHLLPTLLLFIGGILLHTGPGHFALTRWEESLFYRNADTENK